MNLVDCTGVEPVVAGMAPLHSPNWCQSRIVNPTGSLILPVGILSYMHHSVEISNVTDSMHTSWKSYGPGISRDSTPQKLILGNYLSSAMSSWRGLFLMQ